MLAQDLSAVGAGTPQSAVNTPWSSSELGPELDVRSKLSRAGLQSGAAEPRFTPEMVAVGSSVASHHTFQGSEAHQVVVINTRYFCS